MRVSVALTLAGLLADSALYAPEIPVLADRFSADLLMSGTEPLLGQQRSLSVHTIPILAAVMQTPRMITTTMSSWGQAPAAALLRQIWL